MLELRNIVKDYVSGNNVTHALKGISVNFRRNEFVSILGQSGCGKTTTLNIIGGLDRYTSGNLLINGKSTKEYKDRDWDTYRNHSIGFVFQTYNLISHQNILRNVELALTISGVSKEERRQRAYQVLKIVGLEGMEKKKPNQLSGGQCQRVAIARALINNPEILLADEPTGALDSETSVQIMDLLKEVASDRLVIMVTHNPDLANKYSTRIITMADGLLTSDTNPFNGIEMQEEKGLTEEEPTSDIENDLCDGQIENNKKIPENSKFRVPKLFYLISFPAAILISYFLFLLGVLVSSKTLVTIGLIFAGLYLINLLILEILKGLKKPEKQKNCKEKARISDARESKTNFKGKKKKTSMSLWTSMGLSLSNLLSKMKRTVLVTIAGSIGIIGVSAVLGVSRGVKDYIKDLQNDMLSSYPLTIAEESVDYTSLISGLNSQNTREKFKFDPNDPKVGVDSMISYLMTAYSDITNVKTNTIDEKMLAFIDDLSEEEKDNIGAMKYNYAIDPTNNIFGKWKNELGNSDKYLSFNGLTQRYIAELKTVKGFGEYATFVDLFTSFMNELPDNNEYILDQYEIVNGEYSTNEDDLILVVDQDTTLTDIVLAQMGIFDHDSFINIAQCALKEQEFRQEEGYEKLPQSDKDAKFQEIHDTYPYPKTFEYGDLVGREFYYFPQNTIYKNEGAVADDKRTITVNFTIVDGGYPEVSASLTFQSLLGYNVLYGTSFHHVGDTYVPKTIACICGDIEGEITHEDQLIGTNWMAFDISGGISGLNGMPLFKFSIKEGNKLDYFDAFPFTTPAYADETINIHGETDKVVGFAYNAEAKDEWISNPQAEGVNGMKMKISAILRLKNTKSFGSLERGLYFTKAFGAKYINDSKNAKVTNALKDHMKKELTYSTQFNRAFVTFSYLDHRIGENGAMRDDGYASSLNGDLSTSFSDLFMSFAGTNYFDTNCVYLRSLCGYKGLIIKDENDEFKDTEFKFLPREIKIYPDSFEAKNEITNYLDRWNSDETLKLNGETYTRAQRDDLTYTDTISLIVAVIDTFINAITIALVVFTSLSLVVSCFMIAVITYISVVERIKEIGVIRSLGGRKGDVASLFVVETMMTGLFSGVFGIIMTYILQIIVNAILLAKFGLAIMNLTILTALMMVGISVALSVLSGLIPSQSAAHKDPVVALRSNE